MFRLTRTMPVLAAADVLADADFWARVLGFEYAYRHEQLSIVKRDSVQLAIAPVPEAIVAERTQAWVRVRGVESLHADWRRRVRLDEGAGTHPSITLVTAQPWGSRQFTLRDWAGNRVHFAEDPLAVHPG
jgi:catechol 2,3-dioxygenase-like lactoylglutathione lyase family enzyme